MKKSWKIGELATEDQDAGQEGVEEGQEGVEEEINGNFISKLILFFLLLNKNLF
jgi:hypothetical protein